MAIIGNNGSNKDRYISNYIGSSSTKYLNTLLLEVLLDIREQNEILIKNSQRQTYIQEKESGTYPFTR